MRKCYSTITCPQTGFKGPENCQSIAHVINGKMLAKKIKNLLKKEVNYLQTHHTPQIGPSPKLGYVLVGNRPDSELYVKMK